MRHLGRKASLMIASAALLVLTGCGGSSGSSKDSTTVTYTDYKGEERTAFRDPGDAEVLAGKGYEHTLLDGAKDKCQHCHNELYDTWKTSMHAKSWSDKIFQTKHQDFLRTHISKINEDKTAAGGIVYTAGMLEGGASKTCAKCHAPAAVYSGDYKVTVTQLSDLGALGDVNATELAALRSQYEANLAGDLDYDPDAPTTIFGISYTDKYAYTLTYHIGNAHNREGINCATCHSIETVRMMGEGADNNQYTLAKAMRVGPHGPIKKGAGETMHYSADGTTQDMNYFFRLWGPEIYADPSSTPKEPNAFDDGSHPRAADGRYTMKSIDLNGTNGKIHYTGGPFYGPFGVTGLTNTNADDESNRTAQVNPHFDKDTNNHFGNFGKGLCLSCHQRSAGAYTASEGRFMELCSTWIGVSNGTDSNANDSDTSPKCQKCHMPRLADKRVLHQWADPENLFTQADIHLTPHFDPDDNTTTAVDNPVKGEWLNDHAFVGGSKIGSANFMAKIKSGFNAGLSVEGTQAMTTFENLTAHMFPGAHPMRRVLTRVVVTDENGTVVPFDGSATGTSSYATITNHVVSGNAADTIDATGHATVSVVDDGASAAIAFPGRAADLDGSAVASQKFDGSVYTIVAQDGTVKSQSVSGGVVQGSVTNAAIVDDGSGMYFTRIYGHETGKMYDVDGNASTPAVFIVRPGFDSSVVANDNRLMPNEKETYTLDLSGLAAGTYNVTYKVYYMQKGASGVFPTDSATGFLNNAVNLEKKLLISEIFTATESISIP